MHEVVANSWEEALDHLYADSWQPSLQRFRSTFAYRGVSRQTHDLEAGLSRAADQPAVVEQHLLRNFRKYAEQRPEARFGHGLTADSLTAERGEEVEHTLWSALRALEEQASLRRRMSQHAQTIGRLVTAREFEKQAKAAQDRASTMRRLLLAPARESEARMEGATANDAKRKARAKRRTTAR